MKEIKCSKIQEFYPQENVNHTDASPRILLFQLNIMSE